MSRAKLKILCELILTGLSLSESVLKILNISQALQNKWTTNVSGTCDFSIWKHQNDFSNKTSETDLQLKIVSQLTIHTYNITIHRAFEYLSYRNTLKTNKEIYTERPWR